MALSRGLLTLAEEAEAQAKRQGAKPSAWHVAQVIAKRDSDAFDSMFGSGAAERVRKMNSPTDSLPSVREALDGLDNSSSQAVRERLREILSAEVAYVLSEPESPENDVSKKAPIAESTSSESGEHPLLEHVDPVPPRQSQSDALIDVIVQITRQNPGAPLLTAAKGSGRTSAAAGLAALFNESGNSSASPLEVVRLSAARLLEGSPGRNIDSALDALGSDQVAFIDDLEMLLGMTIGSYDPAVAMRLRVAIERSDSKIVLALDERYVTRLEAADADLLADCVPVELPPMSRADLEELINTRAEELASHHEVLLADDAVRLSLAPPPQQGLRTHPGLAIDRLDAACARAALRNGREVTDDDIGLGATPEVAPIATAELIERLRDEVRGQDSAISRVAGRVALTRAQLDLRPERPDGVLLFVGPTGVGKTQLAKALCRELFGDEDRLVRLDMSEYADQWAISRLIGPQPGYVGFTEPDAWLTTRVRRQPKTVLLLDEIEKAHPSIWNTFLQVFDAGRLTDPRGNVADFADVVVVMTSNIGAGSFSAPKLGFAERDEATELADAEERTVEAVRATMRPELVNRLDEVVVFQPLSKAAIVQIAEREVALIADRLTERGYEIEFDPAVTGLVAESGYDPAYGARHLQRNLERLLLMPLANTKGRRLRAEAVDGRVNWTPA